MQSLVWKLLVIHLIANYRQDIHNSLVKREEWYETYDYIVVGGGTAGCVVAARLAEDSTKTVLLLEAGGPQTVTSDMPAKQSETQSESDLNWNYTTIPQKDALLATIDRRYYIPRGKVFGGSSVLNSMNYYRESPEYYSVWDSLYGIKNWSFADVLPYFLKSENNLDNKLVKESNGFHRSGGLLSVSTPNADEMIENFIKAAKMMGFSQTYSDGREPFGVTIMQTTIKDGVRQSSATAFLEPNYRNNLHSIGYSMVTKIIFNDEKRAIGLTFNRNGVNYTVRAKKEIIISAGVIGSAQLLMLSGIGPKDHLQELKIPVICDLRVGDNLQYTIATPLEYDIKNQSLIQKPDSNINTKYEYYKENRGPLTYKASAAIFFREIPYKNYMNVSNGGFDPRVEFNGGNLDEMVVSYRLKNEWKEYLRPYLNRAKFKIGALLRRPNSVGNVRLASVNPFDYPLIDPCLLCDKSDIDNLLKVFKSVLPIYENPFFRQFVELYKNPIPGCIPCTDKYLCDSYLICVIQNRASGTVPVGTCRMGSNNDNKAVVDEKLRVKGVFGLRVIDCSVIPLVSEQTYAITVMIAERGAQFIKDDQL